MTAETLKSQDFKVLLSNAFGVDKVEDTRKVFEFILNPNSLKREVVDEVKQEIASKDFVRAEIANAKLELKQEIAEVKAELKQEIAEVKAELKQEIAEVKAELKQEISDNAIKYIYWLLGVGVAVATTIVGATWTLYTQIKPLLNS